MLLGPNTEAGLNRRAASLTSAQLQMAVDLFGKPFADLLKVDKKSARAQLAVYGTLIDNIIGAKKSRARARKTA